MNDSHALVPRDVYLNGGRAEFGCIRMADMVFSGAYAAPPLRATISGIVGVSSGIPPDEGNGGNLASFWSAPRTPAAWQAAWTRGMSGLLA